MIKTMPKDKNQPLDILFHPTSIAVVGASSSIAETGWVKRLQDFGYKGEIYPINPKAKEIHGLKAYPNICDVPYPVDYAILNVPVRFTLQALRDCVTGGVKFVHCYTAGFSENGSDEGKRLETEMVSVIGKSGTRLLGPNCMGIYCPEAGMTFSEDFPKEKGRIAVVSQSGAEASRLVLLCQDVNLYFSKIISYGNAADLDAPEILEYLARDTKTDVIALYIEGVKNGPAFTSAVRKCLGKKPVVILKAGTTENGTRAALSHTASVTWTEETWNSFFKQTGAIPALTMDEVADIIQGLTRVNKIQGKRVAIIGRGGGIGVIATDICERAGLKVPPFSRETQQNLLQIRPDAGAMFRNPVEPKLGMEGATEFYLKGLPIIDADMETDIILVQMAVDIYGGHTPDLAETVTESAYSLCAAADAIKKPLAVALFSGGHIDTVLAAAAARDILTKAGIAVFPGIESAARAISKVYDYDLFLGKK
jgi:acetyl-CoA synthetase (ADP-forming)/acetyltransferase